MFFQRPFLSWLYRIQRQGSVLRIYSRGLKSIHLNMLKFLSEWKFPLPDLHRATFFSDHGQNSHLKTDQAISIWTAQNGEGPPHMVIHSQMYKYSMLRTVHPTDSYYAKSGRTSEYRSIGLDVIRARETMRLQLMCCTLSNLSLSQFMKGRIMVTEQRKSLRELEGVRSDLIFELEKVHRVATVYILEYVAESGGVGVLSYINCS